jgi:hypothetical protein
MESLIWNEQEAMKSLDVKNTEDAILDYQRRHESEYL